MNELTSALDFGGDLSVARQTPWFAWGGVHDASLGIGWPAGIIGALAIELCDHGNNAVAGAPYQTAIPTQPAGTAGTVLVTGIQPKGAIYGRATWVPGNGNSGANKYFTDDSGVAGTKPRIGTP